LRSLDPREEDDWKFQGQKGDPRKRRSDEMGNGKSQNPSEGPKPGALVYASSGEAKAM